MNKAITEGLVFTPPEFENGLDVWSSGDGTPGSDTYDGSPFAALVPADQDFGGCLELVKNDSTQKLRYTGQTPLQPGCYLQIKARIKAVSGNLPSVRIAGWAGNGAGGHVGGVTEIAPEVALTGYGEVVEVTGIVGSGQRGVVDMAWGTGATYGHFGLDLTGANGGVVRIDDIDIIDITSAFLRDMIGVVDVRDFGAVGDGVTDDSAAFEAADIAAAGRKVLVPAGTYRLEQTTSFDAEVEFEGTVSMPDDAMLLLTKSYDLPTYIDAFGSEELAFRKAFQALINNSDHESLDMGGRKIALTGPIDMAAAVPNKNTYSTRRVIRNGQIEAVDSPSWDTVVVTSQATYDTNQSRTLTNVTNIANIPVGSLVEGNGVGREVYVKSVNVGTGELTLNMPLYDAVGTQTFTFSRFQYLLDFGGFSALTKFGMANIEFQCNNRCSGIMLAPAGSTFSLYDCFISRPLDRGITSRGNGCQGMLIDQCQFLSSEDAKDVPDRTSIAINSTANDVKLRSNRATRFRHFALIGGSNAIVMGNHFFQGDGVSNGVRSAGLVLTASFTSSTVTANYIDNCFIEWTNEHDADPQFSSGFSFSALSITDNVCLCSDLAPWFSYVVVKPYGAGHFLNGLSVTGNKFRCMNGTIDRAERVDTSFADLDFGRTKHVNYTGNTYHNVTKQSANPLRIQHSEASEAGEWLIDPDGELPFGGHSRAVDSVVVRGSLRNSGNSIRYVMPYVRLEQGAAMDQVDLVWGEALRGDVTVSMRIDL